MQVLIRRIYEPPTAADGCRILVDRLWPRGLSKEKARIDFWARECAPSDDLRRWYRHEREKWPEFRLRYFAELDAKAEAVVELEAEMGEGRVTFVFSSKEEEFNNAVALRDYLLERFSAR